MAWAGPLHVNLQPFCPRRTYACEWPGAIGKDSGWKTDSGGANAGRGMHHRLTTLPAIRAISEVPAWNIGCRPISDAWKPSSSTSTTRPNTSPSWVGRCTRAMKLCEAWLETWCHRLKHQGEAAVLEELRVLEVRGRVARGAAGGGRAVLHEPDAPHGLPELPLNQEAPPCYFQAWPPTAAGFDSPPIARNRSPLFQNAPLTQLFNLHKGKSRAGRGFVQPGCIRRADIAWDEADARLGPPDTTFFNWTHPAVDHPGGPSWSAGRTTWSVSTNVQAARR